MFNRTRKIATWMAGLAMAALLVPAASAHQRPHRHHHHHHHNGKTVIVVGKPRPARTAIVVNGLRHGVIDVNVKPGATEVYVNGRFRGTADTLDGYPNKLHVQPGTHVIKLSTPDGVFVEREIHVPAGMEIDLRLDLR